MRRSVLLCLLLLAVLAPSAEAFRLPDGLTPIRGNPAEALAGFPADAIAYDPARRCLPIARPGLSAFARWLAKGFRGQFWGSYRCELWGKGSASLHAENRAIDWHLDHRSAADRAAARKLIHVLLAPDRAGTPQALARRMGVQELIWDCSYWGAGMADFKPYGPCFGRDGTPRRRVGATIAHRDHVHIGFTKAGAMARTTFWRAARKR